MKVSMEFIVLGDQSHGHSNLGDIHLLEQDIVYLIGEGGEKEREEGWGIMVS